MSGSVFGECPSKDIYRTGACYTFWTVYTDDSTLVVKVTDTDQRETRRGFTVRSTETFNQREKGVPTSVDVTDDSEVSWVATTIRLFPDTAPVDR